jgi:DNA primase
MIDFDAFVDWAEKRFGDIIVKGKEVKVNSIFDDGDIKYKLWCNPTGGTKGRDHGVYHCYKTGKIGTLVGLVMQVEGCSPEEAIDILGGNEMADLEENMRAFFNSPFVPSNEPVIETVAKAETVKLTMPEGTYLISEVATYNKSRAEAEHYLNGRKLPITGLYVGIDGRYRERILIPYYDRQGKLIYYNARYIGTSSKPTKYLGPPNELGIGKADVLYMPSWPSEGTRVYVTEGEFDTMALNLVGLHGAAIGGGQFSTRHKDFLAPYKITMAGDNDDDNTAGTDTLIRVGDALMANGFSEVEFVRPPKGFKDWNDFYKKFPVQLVRKYIEENSKSYNEITASQLRLQIAKV